MDGDDVPHPVIQAFEDGLLVPIENIVWQTCEEGHRWVKSYMRFAELGGQSLQLHKEKLGRQDCTITWEFRNWIWVREKWTVLVSKRGVEFDIAPNTPTEEAWNLWHEYQRALGL